MHLVFKKCYCAHTCICACSERVLNTITHTMCNSLAHYTLYCSGTVYDYFIIVFLINNTTVILNLVYLLHYISLLCFVCRDDIRVRISLYSVHCIL